MDDKLKSACGHQSEVDSMLKMAEEVMDQVIQELCNSSKKAK